MYHRDKIIRRFSKNLCTDLVASTEFWNKCLVRIALNKRVNRMIISWFKVDVSEA